MMKMKKFIKKIISKLYYKYCFRESKLGQHIVIFYVPLLLENDCPVTGTYVFGVLNEKIEDHIGLWYSPSNSERGKVESLTDVVLNYEKLRKEVKYEEI